MNTSSKQKHDNNYLTHENGCSIIQCSSQKQRAPASSIISSDPKSVWVTTNKIPQQCTISLTNLQKKPSSNIFNQIGFYCWHQYDSNPSLIQLWVKNKIDTNQDKWLLISKIRLTLLDTWQYFKIDDLTADKLKQIKIKIIQNFGDSKTYLNKISLHYIPHKQLPKQPLKPQSTPQPNPHQPDMPLTTTLHQKIPPLSFASSSNPKPQSQSHHPLKQTQPLIKQLKKANDKISYLTSEQQNIKKTILQQQKIIIKMQDTLKNILVNMEKIQNLQQLKIHRNQLTFINTHIKNKNNKNPNKINKQLSKIISKTKQDDHQSNNDQPFPNNPSQQRKHYRKPPKQIQTIQTILSKAQKKNPIKYSHKHHKNTQPYNKISQIYSSQIQDIIKANNSSQDLSQYSPQYALYNTSNHYRNSQTSYTKDLYCSNVSKTKGDRTKMLQKLKKLLQLKDKKKLQLKQSKNKNKTHSRNFHNYDDDDQQYVQNRERQQYKTSSDQEGQYKHNYGEYY